MNARQGQSARAAWFAVWVGVWMSLATGAAATPKRAEVEVSWARLVGLVDAHPRLSSARQRLRGAQAGVDSAGSVPNPTLETTAALGQAVDGRTSKLEWGLGLSLPLDWLVKRASRVDVASAQARMAEAEVGTLRRDVLLELRLLFWRLLYQQERVKTLAELSAQTTLLAQAVGRRAEKGEVRPVEATRVEVEAEQVEGELDFARSALASERVQLARWLGVGADQPLVAVGTLRALAAPLDLATARERAQRLHPSLRAAAARVQFDQAGAALARSEGLPGFGVEAFTDHELDRRAYGVVLTVDLPLWNRNQGGVRQADAAVAERKGLLEAERIGVDLAVIDAQSRCASGAQLGARYRDRIVPKAAAAAQTIERTYEIGEATLLELVDARRTLLETRRRSLEVLVQAQSDCSRLRALVGEESP